MLPESLVAKEPQQRKSSETDNASNNDTCNGSSGKFLGLGRVTDDGERFDGQNMLLSIGIPSAL